MTQARDVEDRSILSLECRPPDAQVRYGDHPLQIADVRAARDDGADRPLVVFVHGGFWRPETDRGHAGPVADALADAGFTVATVEYRRVPGAPGDTVSDVVVATEALPSLVAPHDGRVIVVGHSAGGHLALLLATSHVPALAGVVALAPVTSLVHAERLGLGSGAVDAFLGSPAVDHPDLDPLELPAPTVPTTIVHGDADEIVPLELAERYVEHHPDTHLVRLPGVGHFALVDPRTAAWSHVLAEIRALSVG